jgi:hypothetical protein
MPESEYVTLRFANESLTEFVLRLLEYWERMEPESERARRLR